MLHAESAVLGPLPPETFMTSLVSLVAVALAILTTSPSAPTPTQDAPAKEIARQGAPYLLDVCPVNSTRRFFSKPAGTGMICPLPV